MSIQTLRRDVDKLKTIQALNSTCNGIEVYFEKDYPSPEALQEHIENTCPPRRDPFVIEFFGPIGGIELGTGPIDLSKEPEDEDQTNY